MSCWLFFIGMIIGHIIVMSTVIVIDWLVCRTKKTKEKPFTPCATIIVKDQNGKVISTYGGAIAEIEANPYIIMGR